MNKTLNKELPFDLKEWINYMFAVELEDMKYEYDDTYVKKEYERPAEEKIKGFPITYKTYVLDKVTEMRKLI